MSLLKSYLETLSYPAIVLESSLILLSDLIAAAAAAAGG